MSRTTFVHLLCTLLSFGAALALDLAGHLSPGAANVAITAIGALGLSSAAAAFRERPSTSALSQVESAAAQLLSDHLPDLIRGAQRDMARARAAFERYLGTPIGEVPRAPAEPSEPLVSDTLRPPPRPFRAAADETPAETPTAKADASSTSGAAA